jgi:hypothetical protein
MVSSGARDLDGAPPLKPKTRKKIMNSNAQLFDPAKAVVLDRDYRPPVEPLEPKEDKLRFACAALTGFMANASIAGAKLNYDQIADACFAAAEAMLRRSKK